MVNPQRDGRTCVGLHACIHVKRGSHLWTCLPLLHMQGGMSLCGAGLLLTCVFYVGGGRAAWRGMQQAVKVIWLVFNVCAHRSQWPYDMYAARCERQSACISVCAPFWVALPASQAAPLLDPWGKQGTGILERPSAVAAPASTPQTAH